MQCRPARRTRSPPCRPSHPHPATAQGSSCPLDRRDSSIGPAGRAGGRDEEQTRPDSPARPQRPRATPLAREGISTLAGARFLPHRLHPFSGPGGAAESAPTLPLPSPPIPRGHEKPREIGTPLNSPVDLEMLIPERSDGMKRVKAPPKNPLPNNQHTRNRACRGVDGRAGAEASASGMGRPRGAERRGLGPRGGRGGGGKPCTETGSWLWPAGP